MRLRDWHRLDGDCSVVAVRVDGGDGDPIALLLALRIVVRQTRQDAKLAVQGVRRRVRDLVGLLPKHKLNVFSDRQQVRRIGLSKSKLSNLKSSR